MIKNLASNKDVYIDELDKYKSVTLRQLHQAGNINCVLKNDKSGNLDLIHFDQVASKVIYKMKLKHPNLKADIDTNCQKIVYGEGSKILVRDIRVDFSRTLADSANDFFLDKKNGSVYLFNNGTLRVYDVNSMERKYTIHRSIRKPSEEYEREPDLKQVKMENTFYSQMEIF